MRSFFIGLVTVSAVGIAAYTVWVFTQAYSPEMEAIISSGGLILLAITTAALGFTVAIHKNAPVRLRRAWLLMGLAVLSSAIAEGIWLYYDVVLKINPYPSLADLFYLIFYPLMLYGVLNLPFAPPQKEREAILGLDMSIMMVLGGLFLWYFILAQIQKAGTGSLGDIIALAYPLADLFVLASLVSLIQRDLENVSRVVLMLLISSIVFTAIADVLFAIFQAYSFPFVMAPLNLLWMVSFWAMMFAAVWQITHLSADQGIERFSPFMRSALVYIAPILSMGLAFVAAVMLLKLSPRIYFTLIGSFALGTLVLIRQYFVLRDNRRLYGRMETLASTDSLTGLYNRHYFNESLQREIKRTQRYERGLVLLLMDLDNFKSYNDTYGHLKGDEILKDVAALLNSRIRTTDLLARFGGDEFIAILPETDATQAQVLIQQLKSAVTTKFVRERLGISVGIAVLQPGMTAESLLSEADRNLYRAKPVRA